MIPSGGVPGRYLPDPRPYPTPTEPDNPLDPALGRRYCWVALALGGGGVPWSGSERRKC